jgi:hypothetical protein
MGSRGVSGPDGNHGEEVHLGSSLSDNADLNAGSLYARWRRRGADAPRGTLGREVGSRAAAAKAHADAARGGGAAAARRRDATREPMDHGRGGREVVDWFDVSREGDDGC